MNARWWVGEPATGDLLLDLHISGNGHFPAPIPITHVRVLMQIDPSNRSATHGVISGIIAPDDAVAWMRELAAWGSEDHCFPDGFDTFIRQTADVMLDGSNEPGQECNGISFGIGFDATAVTLGNVVGVSPSVPPPTCFDGGAAGTP